MKPLTWDSKISLALAFDATTSMTGFECHPVKDDGENVERCHDNPEEADMWGVYANFSDGTDTWIADLETEEMAQRLVDVLESIRTASGRDGKMGLIYTHDSIYETLETIREFSEANYSIDQTGPEDFALQIKFIKGDNRELEFDYSNMSDAMNDIQLLIRDFDDLTFNLVECAFTQG